MAYKKREIIDRVVEGENDNIFKMTKLDDSRIKLIPDPALGSVVAEGTDLNRELLQPWEDHIAQGHCFTAATPLPTFFTHSQLLELDSQDAKLCEKTPNDGNVILNISQNAVYKYHAAPETNAARVYVYQCRRGGETLAGNGEYIGQVVGNYTGCSLNAAMKTGANHKLDELGSDNFHNESNAMFKDTALQLVAEFCIEAPFETEHKIFDYIVSHASEFPKLKLTDGQLNDVMIAVRFKGRNLRDLGVFHLTSNYIDNGMAVEINGKKHFEYWAADCWYENRSVYLHEEPEATHAVPYDAPMDGVYINKDEENDYTLYLFEQGGGEGANISFTDCTNVRGTIYAFKDMAQVAAETSGGEWVYECPITETAFIRNIEASTEAVKTVSGNSGLSYQILDRYAKPGDIHIKTPTNILNLGNAQIWMCRYAAFGRQKQVWHKIF